jgi:hypothetical protein
VKHSAKYKVGVEEAFEKLNSCKSHEEFLGHLACVIYHDPVLGEAEMDMVR